MYGLDKNQQEIFDRITNGEVDDIYTLGGIDYDTMCELQEQDVSWVKQLETIIVSPLWIIPVGGGIYSIADQCCYPTPPQYDKSGLADLIKKESPNNPIIKDRKAIYNELVRLELIDPEETPYE